MTGSLNLIFFAQLNGCSHISPKNIEEIQLLSFLKRQNVAELENHINQMNLSTFLLKKSSGSVSLKLLMHTLFSTRLCSFKSQGVRKEDQGRLVAAWLYASSMNINLDAVFMTIWLLCSFSDTLMISEQLLSTGHQI